MFARIFCLLSALVVFVHASGDFVLLHTPDSVIFKGNKEIDQSLLKELFSASLGFTVKQKSTWNGMAITSPFNLPEAVVAIAVEGVESLGAIKGKKFPLNVDEVEETTWQALSGRLEERDSDNTLVRIYLGDGLDALGQSALGELKPSPIDESSLKALSLKSEEDRKFLDEVQLLRAIAKKVPTAISADNKPDVYWLVVSGLKSVFDVHGKNSLAAKEALTLLNEALHDVSKAFMDAYKNQVLIAAFTNDASQVRHTRSILREKRDTPAAGTPSEGNKETEKPESPKDNDTTQPENGKDNIDSKGNVQKQETDNSAADDTQNTITNHNTNTQENPNKNREGDLLKPETSNSAASDTQNTNSNKNREGDSLKPETSNSAASDTQNTNSNHNQGTQKNRNSEENSRKLETDKSSDIHNTNTNGNSDIQKNDSSLKPDKINRAKDYDEDYPVIFNIILWFGVVFFFSLLAICIFIAEMDPGRDSIIYRMTSNRMKKDN